MTEHTVLAVLILALAIWAIGWYILGTWYFFLRKRWRRELLVSSITAEFAVIRNRLVKLAIEGRIDVNSAAFKSLYEITTLVMRKPERQSEISKVVLEILARDDKPSAETALEEERETWSLETRELIKQTAKALNNLVLSYSWPLRVTFRLIGTLEILFKFADSIVRLLELAKRYVEEKAKERNHVIAELFRSQEIMMQMAG